jgi:hypothetical protein
MIAVYGNGGWRSLDAPSDEQYPRDGAAWIAANRPEARLFNFYDWGGYLIYRYPSIPVFIDGRAQDVYWSNGVLEDYHNIAGLGNNAEALVDEYEIDTMLVRRNSHIAAALRGSDSWREAYRGAVESVFVKR